MKEPVFNPVTFRLTHPVPAPPVCKACGKAVKNMERHAGSALCATAARFAMIERLGLVEVWSREQGILVKAGVAVTVIRDQRGKKRPHFPKPSRRRWYAPPQPVASLRALTEAGIPDHRSAQLLAGPPDELERELAVAALSGRRRTADGGP